MFGEAPLPAEAVSRVLQRGWNMRLVELEYRRIGYGSYHWFVAAGDGSRWFVTLDAVDGPFAARHAYAVARRLADEGLEFVRAPHPATNGDVVVDVGEWLLSVWPWIDGRSTQSGDHASAPDLAATLRCVRRLHDFAGIDPVPELVEDWELSGRAKLQELLSDADWRSGPYSGEAQTLVVGSADRIWRELGQYDKHVEALMAAGTEFVVTHGEPHAGNVVHAEDGPALIDWDTLRWAPKERDLWSLVELAGWRDGYGDGPISPDAVAVYRLQWKLSEIADFAQLLARANQRSPDADVAMRGLRRYLAN